MTGHWHDEEYVTARKLNSFLPRAVVKQIREPRTSTATMTPDGELKATLPAGQWAIGIYIVMERPSGGGTGIRTRWFFPNGVTTTTPRFTRGTNSTQTDPENTAVRLGVHNLTSAVTYASEVFTSQDWTAMFEHAIVTLPDGGEIGLSWAQNVSSADSNWIAPGSFLVADPLDLF